MTTQEVAARFNELAQQEKWFEIQEGKAAVRQKGEDFVSKIREVHGVYTTLPVIGGNHLKANPIQKKKEQYQKIES